MQQPLNRVPVIDISPLVTASQDRQQVADAIGQACRTHGFFYIVGHGVSEELQDRLETQSKAFFAQELEVKNQIPMALAGKAWRGFFPVGGELTSGKPDIKEGLYFGIELDEEDPRVKAGLPLHGPNMFPANMPEFRETVLEYMDQLTVLGHTLMQGISLSLGLEADFFAKNYTGEPLTLFRIFNYPDPPAHAKEQALWGVGEHTDYGVLTILKQDDAGGLQVKSQSEWIEAPPVPNSFVCNIGDMLDRLTKGLYKSTPHRVLNRSQKDRLSFPFFFDPNFEAEIKPIDLSQVPFPMDDSAERWDGTSVHSFEGTYGDYILGKVAKVFPDLEKKVL
ncbi:MAG: isopenicillin N synthase family oxygenase [Cyanothece sp. SIO1E1]|nr:isopenicillin N synthase family oxygenase [Cyanothece sp. SIO1E1]